MRAKTEREARAEDVSAASRFALVFLSDACTNAPYIYPPKVILSSLFINEDLNFSQIAYFFWKNKHI